MNTLEKRLILFAIVFVAIYLGAAVATLYKRSGETETAPLRYESEVPTRAEGRLAMAQLLPPMLVLLTLAIAFAAVKKKRAAQRSRLGETEKPTTDTARASAPPGSDERAEQDLPDGIGGTR